MAERRPAVRGGGFDLGRCCGIAVAHEGKQGFGHLFGSEHVIGHVRRNRAPRHAVEFRGLGRLYQRHAAHRPDIPQPLGSVPPRSGEHDGDCALALVRGERREQHIDGVAMAVGLRRPGHLQSAVADLQIGIGRNHIDVVRLNSHTVLNLNDRHRRVGAQDAGQFAFAIWIEMQHDHESTAAVSRHHVEEAAQRLDAACRRPDSHNWNSRVFGRGTADAGHRPITPNVPNNVGAASCPECRIGFVFDLLIERLSPDRGSFAINA
ncbi:hypothetical protein [Hoeflea sp.]|uniref:hypothetical protein n=1 Tax=Hoeflea sp. TaxID=1940281 RepID=UPI0025BA6EB3|nr:hypothetical protein [Hoeflea sp.]